MSRWIVGVVAVALTMMFATGQSLAASNVFISPGDEQSTVVVGGEADDDKVSVSLAGATITITDSGTGGVTTPGPECSPVNATTVTCPLDPPDPAPPAAPVAPVNALVAGLMGGDDFFASAALTSSAQGGGGNDTLSGGPEQAFLDGGAGNDSLTGGAKFNSLAGGGGNDALTGGPLDDQIFGDFNFSDPGFGGDDTIKGAGGNDLLFGGRGNDLVDGEAGQDQVAGELGDDGLLGGDGDDTMSDGGSGATETGGNDEVNGQGGTDIAAYQRQADVSVSLDGQANDGIAGEADNVQVEDVFAGSGNDTLIGDDAENLFAGQAGNDQIFGLGGGDALIGGSGDDLHDGGAGRDAAQCGAGYDAVLVQPDDTMVLPQCERTGAEVAADTATVSKEKSVKVRVRCPVEEGAACAGTLALSVSGKGIGSDAYDIGAGSTGAATVKLNKKGKQLLEKNGGSLFATAQARTTEPGGTSVQEGDVLVKRKPQ